MTDIGSSIEELGTRRWRSAIRHLVQAGDAAVGPLKAALSHADVRVRMAAMNALWRLGALRGEDTAPIDSSIARLGKKSRYHAMPLLVRAGGAAAKPLINAMKTERAAVRADAIAVLCKIADRRAILPIRNALKDRSDRVRTVAAACIWDFPLKEITQDVVDALVAALDDRDPGVREWAALGIANLAEAMQFEVEEWLEFSDAIIPLINAVRDEDSSVRCFAIYALARIGDDEGVEPVIGALNDERWDVRGFAAGELYRFGDDRAVGPLLAALNDESEVVRHGATESLGFLGDADIAPAIERMRLDPCEYVRETAAEALASLAERWDDEAH